MSQMMIVVPAAVARGLDAVDNSLANIDTAVPWRRTLASNVSAARSAWAELISVADTTASKMWEILNTPPPAIPNLSVAAKRDVNLATLDGNRQKATSYAASQTAQLDKFATDFDTAYQKAADSVLSAAWGPDGDPMIAAAQASGIKADVRMVLDGIDAVRLGEQTLGLLVRYAKRGDLTALNLLGPGVAGLGGGFLEEYYVARGAALPADSGWFWRGVAASIADALPAEYAARAEALRSASLVLPAAGAGTPTFADATGTVYGWVSYLRQQFEYHARTANVGGF